ncbi:SBBP repeat-containing protein [Leptospira montravelensis]|uniref:SBBP repeat-containing protein n=1 Tax=Leptospira montravelensis TaxID=2484961 RepID=UPI001FC9B1DD|nr:SBBP repeat-containing protein [Leptospira montravelensis]
MTGQVGGSGTFMGNPLPGGSMDSYLISLNTNGNIQWVRLLGISGGTTSKRAMSVDKKGSVYITGDANLGIDGQTKLGTSDAFLMKYR